MATPQWRRKLQGDNEWNPLPAGNSEGFWNPEPTPLPRSSPSPTATPTPTATPRGVPQQRGDNSNAGLVNRNLFREDNQANTDWWVSPDAAPTASVTAGVTRSSTSGGLNGEAMFGEPIVQTPTSDARYMFDYESAPSLFPDQNEWWRDGALAQGAVTQSSNEGGSIWEGSEQIGDFGGDLALGTDLNTSLDTLQFGEGYPEVDTTGSPFDSLAEGTDIPVEPDVLDQEYEWTTSPEDRRFLAGPPAEETSQDAAGTISRGGTSLSSFGGNMSLGNFLNTPLALMNFGGGYPQGGGRRGDGLMTGVVTAGGQIDMTTGEQIDAMGSWVDVPGGQEWRENAESNPNGAPPPNDSTGTTTVQIPQGGSIPAGLTIIGHDTRNGQPIYQDEQGNRFVNPGTGTRISPGVAAAMRRGDYTTPYGQSELSRASAFTQMMAGMSHMMSPKMQTSTGDAGHTQFNPRNGRPDITLEGGQIVRQTGGRTIGKSSRSAAYAGGLG